VGQVINLGTGITVSIGELAQMILKLLGLSKEIEQEAGRFFKA
jgi:nucleoside-diphosphate-sugar epimerase